MLVRRVGPLVWWRRFAQLCKPLFVMAPKGAIVLGGAVPPASSSPAAAESVSGPGGASLPAANRDEVGRDPVSQGGAAAMVAGSPTSNRTYAVAGVLVPLGPRHDGLCWETPPHVVEAVRLDPSPVQLMQAHAPRAAGAHLEVAYLSGGHDLRAQDVSGVTPHVPAGLLCAAYPQAVSTPQMPVLELTLVQFRPPQDSSASCVTPEAALAAVLAALKLQAHVPRDVAASPLLAAPEVATDAPLEAGGYGPQPAHACGQCGYRRFVF